VAIQTDDDHLKNGKPNARRVLQHRRKDLNALLRTSLRKKQLRRKGTEVFAVIKGRQCHRNLAPEKKRGRVRASATKKKEVSGRKEREALGGGVVLFSNKEENPKEHPYHFEETR